MSSPDLSAPVAPQTPLMRQYRALKEQHPDAVMLLRLGDFYELFEEDARRAAPVMELVLTQRQGIAMCGLPHHQLPVYLGKLLKAGHRVAVAEQMEDPAQAKGMVRREVVRVVTPGTVIEEELLAPKENCFLVAATPLAGKTGREWVLAALDTSTGEFLLTHIERDESGRRLAEELARLDPREVLLPRGVAAAPGRPVSFLEESAFHPGDARRALERIFKVSGLTGFGVEDHPALGAAGAVLRYLERNQPLVIEGIRPPKAYRLDQSLVLDELALRHLDLLPQDGKPGASLWSVLDHTATAMGGRRLKSWLMRPLRDAALIRARQERLSFLLDRGEDRLSLSAILRECADVDRVLARLAAGGATGRDMSALRRTLRRLPEVRALLAPRALEDAGPLAPLLSDLEVPADLTELLSSALAEEPPFRLSDGGVIRDGYSAALDELRDLARNGRAWISDLEAQEKKATGISSLKIGYTSVFGYYLEVSKANISKVPAAWTRKQTLANAERYITADLKVQEDKILGAEEKSKRLESDLFAQVRAKVLERKEVLRRVSDALADLDAAASLAEASHRGRWTRPRVTDGGALSLVAARHPVVDRSLPAKTPFVPNDIVLDGRDRQILLITGPNMGGKSTYLRQTALIVILAQMGCFVPAESAEVGLVDRVFTRIGAGDNLAAGASTFLVEMQEVSNILHNATPRSLILLDEVGRGTSTYDGVAVAWAVLERLHRAEGAEGPKTLFATHYFELTALPDRLPGLVNVHAAVKEWTLPDGRQEIVFLHQIQPGPAERSFGVHVAQMAGLPAATVDRAKEVLADLERQAGSRALPPIKARERPAQGELFVSPLVRELKALEPERLTPIEALQILHRLSTEAKKT